MATADLGAAQNRDFPEALKTSFSARRAMRDAVLSLR